MDDILQVSLQYRKLRGATAASQAPLLHTRCMTDKTCMFRAAQQALFLSPGHRTTKSSTLFFYRFFPCFENALCFFRRRQTTARRHHEDIEKRRADAFIPEKKISVNPFYPVPCYGVSVCFRNNNSGPVMTAGIFQIDE